MVRVPPLAISDAGHVLRQCLRSPELMHSLTVTVTVKTHGQAGTGRDGFPSVVRVWNRVPAFARRFAPGYGAAPIFAL
jgi:hypothetical protein